MGKGGRKGKGGGRRAGDDKRVAGFDEVRRRNEEFDREAEDAKIEARRGGKKDADSDDEPGPAPVQEIRGAKSSSFGNTEPAAPKASTIDDELAEDLAPIGMNDSGGPKLSKKQREEKNKEEARRRYEKLHAEGKTEEYQKDMSRLEEVRRRREAAAKEKEDAAAKAEQERLAARGGMTAELKSALGGEVRKAGSRTATKKVERAAAVRTLPDDTFKMAESADPEEKPAANAPPPGLAEDDFM
jgi:hypothetical protein